MNPVFKPYLLRAFYEWVIDEGWTPHLSVQVDAQTRVPASYVKNGHVVLNIGANACRNFFIHNDGVAFEARFNGTVHSIWVPIGRVESIFAREAEEGMTFEVVETPEIVSTPSPVPASGLRALQAVEADATAPVVVQQKEIQSSTGKRPTLKVVK
ncbi:MAG: ClpXP protease specificity-enhancing factor [Pseudomonadota bacterium]